MEDTDQVADNQQTQEPTPDSQQMQQNPESDRIKGTFLDADENLKKKRDAYASGILNVIYSKQTKNNLYQILQSGNPEETIPKAVNLVNSRMEEAIQSKGKDVDLGTKVTGVVFTTMELGNLGTAAGFFKLNQDNMPPIIQKALQNYIHAGLKNGTIDPVEAQEAVESIMTDEERQKGRELAAKNGMPEKPGVSAAMEKYAGQRVSKEKQKYMQRMQQMKMKQNQAAPTTQQQPQQGALMGVK